MLEDTRDPSAVQAHVTDGDLYREITGRNLSNRASRFRHMDSAASLHEGQRRAFELLPDLGDAAEYLASIVDAERRRDDTVNLRDLRIDGPGALYAPQRAELVPGVARVELMEQSWSQLVARAPRGVPARLRSNVNGWLRASNGTAVIRSMESASGKAQECYALVSEQFRPHDANMVAREVARAMPDGCKGRVKYFGSGGRFEIEGILARPFDVGGSEIHRVMIGVRSSDDGTMSQQITFKAFRLKCLNGMAIVDSHLLRKVWHKGNANRLQFADALAMGRAAISSFSTHWARARHERFVDATTGADLEGKADAILIMRRAGLPSGASQRRAAMRWSSGQIEQVLASRGHQVVRPPTIDQGA